MRALELIADLKHLEGQHTLIGEEIKIVRQQIIDAMREEGLRQVKTDEETVSIARRLSYQVNEPQWRAWAVKQPNIELDMFYVTTLDKKRVTDYSEKILKTTGELADGISATETDYVSIRKADNNV